MLVDIPRRPNISSQLSKRKIGSRVRRIQECPRGAKDVLEEPSPDVEVNVKGGTTSILIYLGPCSRQSLG